MLKKIIAFAILAIIVFVAAFVGIKYYWVFGDGVKAGELNYITHKGYIFKTYEGRIIQSGFRGQNNDGNGLSSNEFTFSIENQRVADSLMRCSGRNVELHYKEYMGALPWRGMSVFIVDSIISVSNSHNNVNLPVTVNQ